MFLIAPFLLVFEGFSGVYSRMVATIKTLDTKAMFLYYLNFVLVG